MVPLATRRTYRSQMATPNRLSQAKRMWCAFSGSPTSTVCGGWMFGEGAHLPAAEVAAGVARKAIEPQEGSVEAEDHRAHADADADTRLAEGLDRVVGEDAVEDERSQKSNGARSGGSAGSGLTAVAAVGVGHGARRR